MTKKLNTMGKDIFSKKVVEVVWVCCCCFFPCPVGQKFMIKEPVVTPRRSELQAWSTKLNFRRCPCPKVRRKNQIVSLCLSCTVPNYLDKHSVFWTHNSFNLYNEQVFFDKSLQTHYKFLLVFVRMNSR